MTSVSVPTPLLRQFLRRLRPWRQPADRPSALVVPYQVTCGCGQAVTGLRQARFQVVPCPDCGAELFVLPRSPLPRVPGVKRPAIPAAARQAHRLRRRRVLVPVVAGCVLAATLGGVIWWLSSPRHQDEERADVAAADAPVWTRDSLGELQTLLARGQFHQAAAGAKAALTLRQGRPQLFTAAEGDALRQLHAEAALLADLSAESLEDILRHGAGLPAAEWEATVRARYRGKAVVFDAEVRRTADGVVHTSYRLAGAGEEARLHLDALRLLHALPLEEPRRLVFGARLERVAREPPGTWVVRFEPDSGVLLTDAEAAAWCCPGLADAESRALFARQRGWALGGEPMR
jgi:hypothetical protein